MAKARRRAQEVSQCVIGMIFPQAAEFSHVDGIGPSRASTRSAARNRTL